MPDGLICIAYGAIARKGLDAISLNKAPSSSGLGHLVFSQRIRGSNPLGVTSSAVLFYRRSLWFVCNYIAI